MLHEKTGGDPFGFFLRENNLHDTQDLFKIEAYLFGKDSK